MDHSGHQHMQSMPMAGQPQPWKNNFIDCFNPFNTCLLGTCCPCLLYGKITERLKNPANTDPDCFNGSCFGWYCLSCCACQWIIQMMTRGDIRQKHNLTGNGGIDCLTACCLPCCDLIQMDKELADRANLLPTVSQQPEKAPSGMDYQAPQQPNVAYDPHGAPPQHVYQQPTGGPNGQPAIAQPSPHQPIEYQTSPPAQHVYSDPMHATADSKPVGSAPPTY